jgi:hypothetical protein
MTKQYRTASSVYNADCGRWSGWKDVDDNFLVVVSFGGAVYEFRDKPMKDGLYVRHSEGGYPIGDAFLRTGGGWYRLTFGSNAYAGRDINDLKAQSEGYVLYVKAEDS